MKCIFCGSQLADGSKFCHSCGKPVSYEPVFCSQCGAKLETEGEFCPSCGHKILPLNLTAVPNSLPHPPAISPAQRPLPAQMPLAPATAAVSARKPFHNCKLLAGLTATFSAISMIIILFVKWIEIPSVSALSDFFGTNHVSSLSKIGLSEMMTIRNNLSDMNGNSALDVLQILLFMVVAIILVAAVLVFRSVAIFKSPLPSPAQIKHFTISACVLGGLMFFFAILIGSTIQELNSSSNSFLNDALGELVPGMSYKAFQSTGAVEAIYFFSIASLLTGFFTFRAGKRDALAVSNSTPSAKTEEKSYICGKCGHPGPFDEACPSCGSHIKKKYNYEKSQAPTDGEKGC